MTKCERLVRAVNDSFGQCLDHAFKERFECELDTTWNLFTFSMVSSRADGEDLTHGQSLFIADYSAGYEAAMTVAGATQFLLDSKRASDSGSRLCPRQELARPEGRQSGGESRIAQNQQDHSHART